MKRSGNPALWICLSSSFLKYCRKLAAQMLFNANYISSVYLISFCEDESLIYSRQFFYSTIWLRLRLHCLLSNLEPDTRVSLQYDASSILEGDLIQVCFNHIGIKEKEPEYSKNLDCNFIFINWEVIVCFTVLPNVLMRSLNWCCTGGMKWVRTSDYTHIWGSMNH